MTAFRECQVCSTLFEVTSEIGGELAGERLGLCPPALCPKCRGGHSFKSRRHPSRRRRIAGIDFDLDASQGHAVDELVAAISAGGRLRIVSVGPMGAGVSLLLVDEDSSDLRVFIMPGGRIKGRIPTPEGDYLIRSVKAKETILLVASGQVTIRGLIDAFRKSEV